MKDTCVKCSSESSHGTHAVVEKNGEKEIESNYYCYSHYHENFGGKVDFADEVYNTHHEVLKKHMENVNAN